MSSQWYHYALSLKRRFGFLLFQKGRDKRDFRQIKVWSKARLLTLEIYKATAAFPQEERYGLTNQLRRASASVASNIAEGFGRGGKAELARFLKIGMGSAAEVEYQILLARDLALMSPGTYTELSARVVEVKKMLGALIMRVCGAR